MKKLSNRAGKLRLFVFGFLLAALNANAVGTWIPLKNQAPAGIETMLLLPDGTVMAESGGDNQSWYRLSPASNGSYSNGTWSSRSSMNYSRLYFASQVLPDGRVFVAGAEYGSGAATAEIYNIANDSWSIISVPAGIINTTVTNAANGANFYGFSDSGSVLLDNGKILIEPVYPGTNGDTCIYDSIANTWTTKKLFRGNNEDEASWVKLPDGSILTVDFNTQNSERYNPSSGQWVNDANLPVNLYDAYGAEMGPGLLLPNGKVFYIGSTPYTAIYTPSGNSSPGTWIQGPNITNNLGAPDSTAAMMYNGKMLCCLSPTPTSATNIFTTPTYFYEYDYTAGPNGSFVPVNAPGGGASQPGPTYYSRMLALPDGTILYSSGGAQLYVYQPDEVPLFSAKPIITSVTYNPGATLHVTGKLFNGISQGAAYGDDVQMDSNFPLIRFTDGSGNVTYGTTYNWSSTGVQTGNQLVTTECALSGAVAAGPGAYTMQVVANGIASDPVGFPGPVWVDFNFSGSPKSGTYSNPFNTLAQGVNTVAAGAEIFIKPGISHEAITITKAMNIIAVGGTATIGVHP